jgi:hypothetical protein
MPVFVYHPRSAEQIRAKANPPREAFASKYKGRCPICGRTIKIGDLIHWTPMTGAVYARHKPRNPNR